MQIACHYNQILRYSKKPSSRTSTKVGKQCTQVTNHIQKKKEKKKKEQDDSHVMTIRTTRKIHGVMAGTCSNLQKAKPHCLLSAESALNPHRSTTEKQNP
jgi:hypothetical protein